MSLEREDMQACAGCGQPCDGDCCDQQCVELAYERQRQREIDARMKRAESLYAERARRKAARAAQLANILGPKA